MRDLTKLIERLGAAKEGSRELDREVAFAVGWTTSDTGTYRWICPHGRREIDAPGFTWSLDAALTLVPKGLNIALDMFTDGSAICGLGREPDLTNGTASYPTPALALAIAALKARQSDAP